MEQNQKKYLCIDEFDQYMQDFLETINYQWDKTYIDKNGNFVKVVSTICDEENFFDGNLKAVFITDNTSGKQKAQILKATEYSLAFYEYNEESLIPNKLDRFEVSIDLTEPFQTYMLKQYGDLYLNYLETVKYDAKDTYQESKGKDKNAFKTIRELETLLPHLKECLEVIKMERQLDIEFNHEELSEEELAEIYQLLKQDTLSDDEEYQDDGYSYEESDYDDEPGID